MRDTGETFDRPADFRIDDYLRGSFRSLRGEGVGEGEGNGQGEGNICHQVILRFSPATAKRVAERIWHRSQQKEMCSDGSLLLHFELSDLREVLRWVLSWGRDCSVQEPKQLRQMVMREVQAMLTEQ